MAGILVAVGLLVSLFGASSSAGAIAVLAGFVVLLLFVLSGVFSKGQVDDGEEKKGKSSKVYIITRWAGYEKYSIYRQYRQGTGGYAAQ